MKHLESFKHNISKKLYDYFKKKSDESAPTSKFKVGDYVLTKDGSVGQITISEPWIKIYWIDDEEDPCGEDYIVRSLTSKEAELYIQQKKYNL